MQRYPAYSAILMPAISALTLSYSEHLSPTYGAHTLGCRLTILHGYTLGILHVPFGTALHTVCLHQIHLPFLSMNDKLFTIRMSIAMHKLYATVLLSQYERQQYG